MALPRSVSALPPAPLTLRPVSARVHIPVLPEQMAVSHAHLGLGGVIAQQVHVPPSFVFVRSESAPIPGVMPVPSVGSVTTVRIPASFMAVMHWPTVGSHWWFTPPAEALPVAS